MPDTDHTTPDPTHGRVDRDIQAAVDDWGPKSLGQRVAVENTLQAQRDAGREPLAATAQPARERPPDEPAGRRLMDVAEFRRLGYLQEVNRQFLHPLGLALAVNVADGAERFSGVWDDRDDPEGIRYAPGVIDLEKTTRVLDAQRRMADSRMKVLGYVVQPVDDQPSALDALGDPQQPLQVAATPPTEGAGSLGVEPAPEPTANLAAASHGLATAAEPAPEPDSGPGQGVVISTNNVRVFTADRGVYEQERTPVIEVLLDELANQRRTIDRLLRAGKTTAEQRDAARAELATAASQAASRWQRMIELRQELAAARRDAAADALEWASRELLISGAESILSTWAAEIRNSTRPVLGSPEPAGDSPTTTDTEE